MREGSSPREKRLLIVGMSEEIRSCSLVFNEVKRRRIDWRNEWRREMNCLFNRLVSVNE